MTHPPTPFLETFAATINPTSVLDIGCGNGRNSLFLKQQGWDVTATDEQTYMIPEVRFIKSSLFDMPTTNAYDLVLCFMVLHFLPSAEAVKENVDKLKQLTSSNGYLLLSVMTNQNQPGVRPYLFGPHELKSHFEDWNMIKEENTLADPVSDKGEIVSYYINRVIVQNK